jgi:hypothetical protein
MRRIVELNQRNDSTNDVATATHDTQDTVSVFNQHAFNTRTARAGSLTAVTNRTDFYCMAHA